MPRIPDNNQFEWDTVEFPLSAGVDLREPARSVQPPRLLKLQNARHDANIGVRKRRGHVSYTVRSAATLVGTTPSDNYLFGYGPVDGELELDVTLPDSAHLRGMAKRDDEVLALSGHQLYSWPANANPGDGWGTPVSAVMPSARTYPVAKRPNSQTWGDAGLANGMEVVAYYDVNSGRVKVDVYDADTRAPRLQGHTLDHASPLGVRVVPVGDWAHILVSTATTLDMYSVHTGSPGTVRDGLTTPGDCDTYFDVQVLDDTHWALVKRDTSDVVKLTHFQVNGAVDLTYGGANRTLTTDANLSRRVAFAAHPVTGVICLVWQDNTVTTAVKARCYEATGAAIGAVKVIAPVASGGVFTTAGAITEMTVAPRYLRTTSGVGASGDGEKFDIYVSDSSTGGSRPITHSVLTQSDGGSSLTASRQYGRLASGAFRVGQKTFVLLQSTYRTSQTSLLQYTYFLVDDELKPVGAFEHQTAQTAPGSGSLPGVYPEPGQTRRDASRFRGLLFYRTRLDSANNDQYDEVSMKALVLDFMPKVRAAQLGRSTYFAGAQLHEYDGQSVYEAGFHITTENVTMVAGAAGNLTGSFQYRIRPAYKTAQGEEIVGPAITTTVSATLAAQKMTVDFIPLGFTRKTNVYWLIYRRAATGTQYYLVSNRDPSVTTGDNDCVINDPTATTLTFTDNLSDASLVSRETDRADASLMEPFAPPACEVIGAGRDRLWLAGGEIAPGTILPSLVYTPEARVRTAEFNTQILTPLDRSLEPITGFGFLGHSTLVFRREAIYAFEADGPSNTLVGGFDYPRVLAADTGAAYPEGIVLTTAGILFVSPSGIQLLGTNYQLQDIGDPVRSQAANAQVTSAILVAEDQEVRFYRSDGDCLVFNYRTGSWATWTGLETVGVVTNPETGLAILGRAIGHIWVETAGVWGDSGSGYRYGWQSAQLHGGVLLGSQRVRRIAVIGDYLGAHTLHARVYMDDRDYPDDAWSWNPATDINVSTWGEDTWGAGAWGDTNLASGETIEDSTYVLRKRLRRQKCSRISVEFHDGGALTEGPAFTAFALEVGRRGGLIRLPARTFTAE